MPTELVLLPAIESAFVPTAYSRAHAVGLWQFIPATARRYGIKMNWWYDGRRDVVESTRAALDYLEFLHEEFKGNWFYALAAYNAGEGSVAYAIRKNKSRGRDTRYVNLRLKSETRRYVPKLIALKNIVDNPARFGITLASVADEPYFSAVDTGGQIDLNVVRELSGWNAKEMRHLNAAFKRWSTDPDGPHRLLVPWSKAANLELALAALPESARVKWGSYTIRQGDTLGRIARKYGVSVSALQRSNRLNGTLIRAGNTLLIPLSSGSQDIAFSGATAAQDSLVHRVRSGDTLWGIARRYNVYVSQLTQWNSIRTHDTLRLGQNILVYMN
jgi:membrane-bound lytic murein transglycosylase D